MDSLAFLLLDAFGMTCWALGARRPLSPLWVKIGVVPAELILAWYFWISVARSTPELWSGQAEAGTPTVLLIAFGIYSVIAERKPKTNTGGPQSA